VKKTVKQLKDAKNEALANMQALVDLAESEDRNLTADEQTAWNEAEKTATDMTERVDRLERSLNLTKTPITPIHHNLQDIKKTDKDLKKFRFTDAAIAAYNGSMSGLVREMHQEAQNENKGRLFRGVGIPSIALEQRTDLPGASSDVKPTDVGSFIDQLQANLTLGSIANFYSGLSADRKFPIVDGISTSFIAEAAAEADAVSPSGSLTNITLSPKKMISVVSMSAEMMTQNASAEAALQRNMTASIAATWEEALLKETDVTGAPESFWADAHASSASTITLDDLYTLEQEMLDGEFNPANSRFAYLFNPKAIAQIKAAMGNEGGQNFQVFNNNATINSIPYYVSSLLGKGATETQRAAIVSGSNMHLATFGGLDVISDRYTDAARGLSRLVIVNLVDSKMSRIANSGGVSSFYKIAVS
jgi:HK97 family phage major capsid protein